MWCNAILRRVRVIFVLFSNLFFIRKELFFVAIYYRRSTLKRLLAQYPIFLPDFDQFMDFLDVIL